MPEITPPPRSRPVVALLWCGGETFSFRCFPLCLRAPSVKDLQIRDTVCGKGGSGWRRRCWYGLLAAATPDLCISGVDLSLRQRGHLAFASPEDELSLHDLRMILQERGVDHRGLTQVPSPSLVCLVRPPCRTLFPRFDCEVR